MRLSTLGASVVLIAVVSLARGEVVVVKDDLSLRKALAEASAGTVIRIAAGNYRGGLSRKVRGTKHAPIVIEGDDAQQPPVIVGGGAGIHLSDTQHVTLKNLVFRGATGNGINIDDQEMDQSAVGIVIENVRVEDVGPVGNCDGIKLSGVREFVVRSCTIEGWGGSAIDMVGCADGLIERCVMRGKAGFSSASGPQVKGGSRDITIRQCLFDRAGGRAVNAGGSTGLPYFRPKDASYEAKDLTIEQNMFIGSQSPVAFVGVDGALFRHNTIVEPEKWVMRILQESRDPRFVRCRNVSFERNLIIYRKANVRVAVNIGPDTSPQTFRFKENWWWCADSPHDRPDLPTREQGGRYAIDPELKRDDAGWHIPTNSAAQEFGARLRQ